MLYESTRGNTKSISSSEAILKGIAADGGLFVPQTINKFDLSTIGNFSNLDYKDLAMNILSKYLDDFDREELHKCIESAYSEDKFENGLVAPVTVLNENVSILELWHGPTCAFKDVALQILPHFTVKAAQKTGELDNIAVLVATSGDTGKAAMEGFRDVENTKVIVFYPRDGVSEIQKFQMITQEGKNVFPVGIEGNFDDAQTGVKSIFNDPNLNANLKEAGIKLSSANSINWGRLVPQIVYYFYSYLELVRKNEIKAGDKINFVIPTGNFGNILSAYYAMEMGLPVNRLICASNENNILTDFINTGFYNINRTFVKTSSPSMDILISSNLERLLFELTDRDSKRVNKWMKSLKLDGIYEVDEIIMKKISKIIWGGFSNEAETLKTIEYFYKEYNYVIDTHTAVAVDVYDKYVISTGDITKTIIVSTASPFKFIESVSQALFGKNNIYDKSEFKLFEMLSKNCGLKIPKPLLDLNKKKILHNEFCSKNDMALKVREILMK